MKINASSNHPAAIAYRNGSLADYNLMTFGSNHRYFFKYSKGILYQRRTRGHQFHYSDKFSYIISSPIYVETPRFANCMEFVQRVAFILKVADACTFHKIKIKPFTVTYLPYLKRYKPPFRTIEEIQSCKHMHSKETVRHILEDKDIEMHITRMWSHWGVIAGPHFCLVFGKPGRYFSIAVGQIWSVNGESRWNDIFVSIPDPLILKCQPTIISSTIVRNATDLVAFFQLKWCWNTMDHTCPVDGSGWVSPRFVYQKKCSKVVCQTIC